MCLHKVQIVLEGHKNLATLTYNLTLQSNVIEEWKMDQIRTAFLEYLNFIPNFSRVKALWWDIKKSML